MSIEIKNLSFTYDGTNKVIDNLTFSIGSPQIVGIVGQTGSGKSTLAQLIAGLLRTKTGHIIIDEKEMNDSNFDWGEFRQKLGIVFQYPETQLFEQTVEKDVAFGLKNSKLSKKEIATRIRESVELMNMNFDAVKFKSPLALSGGEKRKIAIAGVLATKPKYLILDEPIAGLDPLSRNEFMQTLCALKEKGTTIIIISHNADCLVEYADRIILMDKGKNIGDDKPNVIFSDYDLLNNLGIGTCSAQEIIHGMEKKGINIKKGIVKYSELLEEIKTWART